MKIRGAIFGVLLTLSGVTVSGCSAPLPTQSLGITQVEPVHTRYVNPDHAVPYADQWDNRIQILVAWNQTSECGLTHVSQTVRVTALYDCTVDPLGQVRGSAVLFEGKDASKAISGAFTGTLDGGGGLTGLAVVDYAGVCGTLRLSSSLALVPEVPVQP